MALEEEASDITVRAYRLADEPVLVWLRQNGHLHGDVEGDPAVPPGILAEAKQGDCQHVLVVEADGQVIGATAIAKQREPIAHLVWLCIAPDWQAQRLVAERLVEAATVTAWELGALKLVVHTSLHASQVADFFYALGFVFHRERTAGSSHVIEFFLNLYARPQPRQPQE